MEPLVVAVDVRAATLRSSSSPMSLSSLMPFLQAFQRRRNWKRVRSSTDVLAGMRRTRSRKVSTIGCSAFWLSKSLSSTTLPIMSIVNLVAYSSSSKTSFDSAFLRITSLKITLASTMYGTRVMRCVALKPGLNMVLKFFQYWPSTLTMLFLPRNWSRNWVSSIDLGRSAVTCFEMSSGSERNSHRGPSGHQST